MIAGLALLGAGAYLILRKADAQLVAARAILAQRRTIARTGVNTPSPAQKKDEAQEEAQEHTNEDSAPVNVESTSVDLSDIDEDMDAP